MVTPLSLDRTKIKCPVNAFFKRCSDKSVKPYDFSISNTIDSIDPNLWNGIVNKSNPFLTFEYLHAIEKGNKSSIKQYYAILKDGTKPLGAALFQITYFEGNSIRELINSPNAFTDYIARRLGFLDTKISQKIIVCGNVFTTGHDGYAFSPEIDIKRGLYTLTSVASTIESMESKSTIPTGILFKDFTNSFSNETAFLKEQSYSEVPTEPTMIMNIDEKWSTFDDYLQSLISKFRVKAKRAYTKSAQLKKVPFNTRQIDQYSTEIAQLYSQVMDRCDYRTGIMEIETLINLKKTQGDQFIFDGYFLDDKLVGFKTSFLHNQSIYAQLVGLDYSVNRDYSVYSRILYDYIKIAIENRAKTINFGRTASEIKSSVGAIPIPMKCTIKHRNPLLNILMGILAQKVKPKDFHQRKPFRQPSNSKVKLSRRKKRVVNNNYSNTPNELVI
jgi:predicted N-acyltransferase